MSDSLNLCDLMDCSPLGSSVLGVLQARILERVASPSAGDLPNLGIKTRSSALQADSLLTEPAGKTREGDILPNGEQQCQSLSTQHFVTSWTGLQSTKLLCSWGFSRQEYLSGLQFPSPRDLPYPGIEPRSPAFQADSLPSELHGHFPLNVNASYKRITSTQFPEYLLCLLFYFILFLNNQIILEHRKHLLALKILFPFRLNLLFFFQDLVIPA